VVLICLERRESLLGCRVGWWNMVMSGYVYVIISCTNSGLVAGTHIYHSYPIITLGSSYTLLPRSSLALFLLLNAHSLASSLSSIADEVASRYHTSASSHHVQSRINSPLVVSPAPWVMPVTASPSPFPPAATTLPVASVTLVTPLPTVLVAAPSVFPALSV
jgi:hypothetical protein